MRLPADVCQVTQTFLARAGERRPGLIQALYLHGSLGFGEYFPGRSDVDFVAILAARPDDADLDALDGAHAQARAAHPRLRFEGCHLLRCDLARSPAQCPDVPYAFEGAFGRSGRFSINPVTWHELAWHGVTVRGPELTGDDVWTDASALRAFTRANLSSYWANVAEAQVKMPAEAAEPAAVAWCVLGVSRLHHLLATGSMTSKSGAGRHALSAFGPQWHPIVHEALRAREQPDAPSAYGDDAARRGRDATAFTAMAIQAGLALRP
jgi:hypothetical protein